MTSWASFLTFFFQLSLFGYNFQIFTLTDIFGTQIALDISEPSDKKMTKEIRIF